MLRAVYNFPPGPRKLRAGRVSDQALTLVRIREQGRLMANRARALCVFTRTLTHENCPQFRKALVFALAPVLLMFREKPYHAAQSRY